MTNKGIDGLRNTGIREIGDPEALRAPEKTLVVVGAPRGGTSLVAGVLSSLGVFMGTYATAPVFEDLRLASLADADERDKAAEVMREYDREHAVWGYKRPMMLNNFGAIHDYARNPVYLFIFKDLFSLANRESISMRGDLVEGLRTAHGHYDKIIGFVERRRPTGLMLSYDRVMQDPAAAVDAIIGLLPEDSVSTAQRDAAIAFIEPNPEAYLDSSRVTRAVGEIHTLEATTASGRARYEGDPNRGIEVEMAVDGQACGVVTGLPDGSGQWHDFRFDWESSLQPGQTVSFRLTDDVRPFGERTWQGD